MTYLHSGDETATQHAHFVSSFAFVIFASVSILSVFVSAPGELLLHLHRGGGGGGEHQAGDAHGPCAHVLGERSLSV